VIDYLLVAFFAFVSLALTPRWRAFVDCCIAHFFGTGELLCVFGVLNHEIQFHVQYSTVILFCVDTQF